jgi:hypothetical protein
LSLNIILESTSVKTDIVHIQGINEGLKIDCVIVGNLGFVIHRLAVQIVIGFSKSMDTSHHIFAHRRNRHYFTGYFSVFKNYSRDTQPVMGSFPRGDPRKGAVQVTADVTSFVCLIY